MSESLFLTAKEVAALLGISVWFVYDHGEELGLVKLGGANRYRRTHVERYIADLVAEAEAPARPTPVTPLRPVPSTPVESSAPRRRPRRVPLLEPGRRAA